ncbi:MAG: DUF1592 domain-containing protein [Myxococcaceae bacterium]|nr:DUF1592 domain-containing protein [Myxococcaceae bacterium]
MYTLGCTGRIELPVSVDPSNSVSPPDVKFTCNPDVHGTPTALQRLSALQYRNTLKALFSAAPNFDATNVASAQLAKLPVDSAANGYASNDDRLSDVHVQTYYNVAEALAQSVVDNNEVLAAVVGSCAIDSVATDACIDVFLNGFAARTYRRPLTQTERDRYQALNDGTRDGKEVFRSLIFSVLMAPQFLYHAEVEGQAIGKDDAFWVLDPYALASRLAYHFWQEMPDATLFAAAQDGSLATEAGYQQQLSRVVADPRTRRTMKAFYDEWLQLGNITQFVASPAFATFSQDTTIGQPGADHLAAGAAEIEEMAAYYTWTTQGSARDLLTSDKSFTKSSHVASIYGVQAWDGTSTPPLLPSPERAGLLTRFAFLASGTYQTNPIHRGATVRKRLMCGVLLPPPVSALPPNSLAPPASSNSLTTRQRYEAKVVNEPCASCHARMNPIGYVLEQYDALGRHRDQERIFDEMTGQQVNLLPVNATAAPRIVADDLTEVSTGADLSRLVAESGAIEACLARQYFRFTYRRNETNADGCVLERVRTAASTDLRAALLDIANDESFKTRKVELP